MRYFKLFQLLSTLFLVLGSVQAQPILFGLTTKGGANGAGTLIKIDGSKSFGSGLTVIKHFDAGTGSSGRMAYGGMIKAGDLFYGMTSKGGANDAGTIFSFNPATELFTKLYDFGANVTDGKEPFANLMLASNGKLYGTTQFGGSFNKGTIFSFDTSIQACSFIYSFSGGDNDGANPICSLVQIPDGRIFGLTKDGGNLVDAANGFGSGIERCGTIFSIDPTNNAYIVEHKFITATFDNNGFDIINDIGFNPHGSLAYHGDKGKLYGTTLEGNGGTGSVFSFDAAPYNPAQGNAAPFQIVKALDQSVSRPYSTPLIGDNGKLYFTTLASTNEAGTISQLDLDNGNTLTVLRDFTYYQDTLGTVPNRELFQASDRKLYGMVTERWPNAQINGYGSVYQLGIDDKQFAKLANLDTLQTGNGSAWLSNGANSFVEYINNTPAPLDTDGDGVPDTLDIDDDNDGITDDAENGEADLLLLNPSFELTNPLITTGAGGVTNSNMAGWKTTAQDSTFEVWQNGFLTVPAYEGNQFIEINGSVAATVYQDFTSTPGAIIRWTFAHRGRSGIDVVKMKVGPTGGTMVDITTASDGNTTWGVYTGVYTVPAGQTSTRIAFESVSSSNGDPTYGNFLDGIKFEVEPAFRDTDGDGIVNRLDLDSDGDGCSDAKEGGATTSVTANFTFSGLVGANGLTDVLETTADSGVINYTSTYGSYAIDAVKNKCDKDTDADGVPDTLDIDDDNDGITDDAENGEATLLLLNPSFELTNPLITTGAGGVTNSNMAGWKTTAQDSTFEVWQNGFLTVPAYEGNQFIEINGSVAATVYQDFTSTPGAIIRWTFAHRGRSGIDVVKMKVGPTGGTMVDITTASDGNTTWGVYTGVYTVPAGQTSTRIAFESVSSSNGDPTYGNFLDGIKFEVEPAFRDTDGDGIVNRLDPDSDGDGCSDAKEGGATTSTGADYKFTSAVGSNGLADELETTVDNGEVKYTSTYLAFATDATKNACKTKPTFTIVASACSNNAPSLPLTSDNGVSGTWNPAQVNKASANTTKYVFTPSDLTTADTTSVTIAITLYQKPAFTIIPSVCLGATAPTLATTSNNGITGTWTPSSINTVIANTTKYVFVPSPGGPCIDTASMTIAVAPCCVANVDDKYENNGSKKLAKSIVVGTTIEANIKNKLDEDYYKFTTTTAGDYTITFTPKAGSVFKYPHVELYTANGYVLKPCSVGNATSYTLKLKSKTTYYVEVEDKRLLTTACYNLVVNKGTVPTATVITTSANLSITGGIEDEAGQELLRISSNPTYNNFKVYNSFKSKLTLRVVDVLGRLQQQLPDLQPGSSLEFGSNYRPGNYYIQATGTESAKTYKLVKQ